jgi:hypothetical protein
MHGCKSWGAIAALVPGRVETHVLEQMASCHEPQQRPDGWKYR